MTKPPTSDNLLETVPFQTQKHTLDWNRRRWSPARRWYWHAFIMCTMCFGASRLSPTALAQQRPSDIKLSNVFEEARDASAATTQADFAKWQVSNARNSRMSNDEGADVGDVQPAQYEDSIFLDETYEEPIMLDGPIVEDGYFEQPELGGPDEPMVPYRPSAYSIWNYYKHRFWLRGEYLLWSVNGFDVPPLLTTSSAGTARDNAGILGEPGTSILFGNSLVADQSRSGGRGTLNFWFDDDHTHGIEAIYTGVGSDTTSLTADSQQYAILARPYFNIEPGVLAQDAELIAYPGLLTGGALIEANSNLQSVEVLYRQLESQDSFNRVDFLIGWRYATLDESLLVSDFKRVISSDFGLAVGTTLRERDLFETSNEFNGFEVGLVSERRSCRWTLELLTKLALGENRTRVNINGQAEFVVPGGQPPVTTTPAGLLAQQSNMGVYESNNFAIVPEIGATLGYDLNNCWRATLGYTFLYWTQVARPGEQIDFDLNLTQLEPTGLVGPPRPVPNGLLSDLYAQGLRIGLSGRF